ncbi:MAG: SH3 domain-containing protein [Microscillaceae bacterium]|nr:SH3 domain-containing protein [Microscillaceae bacterium]MDW8460296.1 SH3 domain-containing protein [Cytophagales bacterium]
MKKELLALASASLLLMTACGSGGNRNNNNTNNQPPINAEQKAQSKEGDAEAGESKADKTSSEGNNKDAVVTAKSGLSLRKSPDFKAKLITVLPANAVVEVIEKDKADELKGKKGNWYKVEYGKYQGYAFGAYLKMGHKLEATNDTKINTASEAEGGNNVKTNFGDAIQKALVNAKSGLTMRKEPKQSGQKIVTIPRNAEVAILEYTDNFETINDLGGSWCKVRYGKNEGYIFSAYLNFSTASINAKSGLVLRKEPNKNGQRITIIPSNAEVYLILNDDFVNITATDESGNIWYKVRYGNFEGWASGQFLNLPEVEPA